MHTIIPQSKLDQKFAKQLITLGEKRDRSAQLPSMGAILEYFRGGEVRCTPGG